MSIYDNTPKEFSMDELSPELEKRINSLVKGAVDMHCHSGPSVMPRKIDHIQALEEASDA